MTLGFDAGELDLDDIKSKSLSDEQLDAIINQIKSDVSLSNTVGDVLSVLTKASLIALKLGLKV
jgi:hypothetical protein